MKREVNALLLSYSPDVRSLALKVRKLILDVIPNIEEQVDTSANIIGYGFGPGYADLICVIMPQKSGVNLGFYKGTQLPDPKGLLEGTGKLHRHIKLRTATDVQSSALKALLKAAVAAYKKRTGDSA
ncbi:DUF1801 domain-containing protein [candidate division KSB1 bacterium]|nr:DUF1801 domain-containing protein [candidate division KSB1 bacterium]